jgi:phosphate transport system substrate-binding protein
LSRIFWIGNGVPSFVAGDIGQRIILKSGLLPVRMPGRNIIIKVMSILIRQKILMNEYE